MVDIKHTQNRIKNIVKAWILLYPEAYRLVCEGVEKNRKLLQDEHAGHKGEHTIKRALLELPEDLYNQIMDNLDKEEIKYFITKDYSVWFGRQFPEFCIPEKI